MCQHKKMQEISITQYVFNGLGFRIMPQIMVLVFIFSQPIQLAKVKPLVVCQAPVRRHQSAQSNAAVGAFEQPLTIVFNQHVIAYRCIWIVEQRH